MDNRGCETKVIEVGNAFEMYENRENILSDKESFLILQLKTLANHNKYK
jgi:hypothetical protein